MAGKDNLIPQAHKLTVAEQSAGGIASGRARAEKRDLRRALEALLERDWQDKNGNTLSGTDAIAAKLFEQAMKGNIRAFETLRDTVGQKPIEKVMVAEVEPQVVDEIEKMVLGE